MSSLDPGEYEYQISSDDDETQTGTLTIEELPTFEVTLNQGDITETNDTNSIDISVGVENTGDLRGEQEIELNVSGTQISETETVSRDSGEDGTVTFSNVDISSLGQGEYTYTVASDNETASRDLSIVEPPDGPNFQVDIRSGSRTVKEDRNSIDISVDTTNYGDQPDSQDIDLTVTDDSSGDTVHSDSKRVGQLAQNETSRVTFSGVTVGDPGSYTIAVDSNNGTDSESLTVEEIEPASFELSDMELSSSPVKEDEVPIDVSVDVQNTGDKSGQQTLELTVSGGSLPDHTDTVTLDAGRTTEAQFTDVDVGSLEPGTYTLEVNSNGDSISRELTVEEATSSYFELSNLDSPTVRDDADSVSISADIRNIGDGDDRQTIQLSLTGSNNPSKTKPIDAGERKTVTFDSVDVSSLDPGEYTYTIDSGDDRKSSKLTVIEAREESNLVVENVPDRTVKEYEDSADISVDITNYGDQSGSQDIDLTVTDDSSGDQIDSATRRVAQLSPDDTQTVTFGNIAVDDPGSYTLEVSSENSTAAGSLTVEAVDSVPATFELLSVDPAEPTITEGEKIEKLAADIENTGDETGDQRIQLTVTDESGTDVLVTNQTIDIDDAEVETVEFNDVAVDGLEPGDYTYTVASSDDTISGDLIVEEDEGLDGGGGGGAPTDDESDESDTGNGSGGSGANDTQTAGLDDDEVLECTVDADEQPFEDQNARSLGFHIEFDDNVFIEEITFEELGTEPVTVAELSGCQREIEDPGAPVLETADIDPPAPVEDDPGTVTFTLNEAQLDNVDSVQLSRWTRSGWVHNDAERVESDDGEPTFAADVEGFSVFAVTTADGQNEATDETGSGSDSDDATDETQPESDGETDSTDETASTDTPGEPVEEGSLGGAAPVIGMVMLVMIVSVAAIAAARESGQI